MNDDTVGAEPLRELQASVVRQKSCNVVAGGG